MALNVFNTDITEPCISPGLARKTIEAIMEKSFTGHRFNMIVKRTIGAPSIPAEAKSIAATYSIQDLGLIILGMKLAPLLLSPNRVIECTEFVRDSWEHDLVNEGYVLFYGGAYERLLPLISNDDDILDWLRDREIAMIFDLGKVMDWTKSIEKRVKKGLSNDIEFY